MKNYNLTDDVLTIISQSEKPLTFKKISQELEIKNGTKKYKDLKNVLSKLVDNDLITRDNNRKYSLSNTFEHRFEGVFNHSRGNSKVITSDNKYYLLHIKDGDTHTALDGDKVLAELTETTDNKFYGKVVKVLERKEQLISGKIEQYGDNFYLVPEEDKFHIDFIVENDSRESIKGMKAKGKLLKWKRPTLPPIVELTYIEEDSSDIRKAFDRIVKEYELDESFSNKIMEEVKNIDQPSKSNKENYREDITDKLIFTIDPIDAKDFDDALSLDKLDNGNILLGVHIADVTNYVKENSATDIEARERGNSTYLVDRVIPMLPEKLSNDICSLKPNIDRNAYSVFIEMDDKLEIVNYELKETLINSKRRYHYDEVLDILDAGKGDNYELLKDLSDISKNLRKKRFDNGGIDFSSSELRFELDENGVPKDSYLKTGTDATKMIEEFMLLANKVVTWHLKELSHKLLNNNKLLPFIYRVHEEPEKKLVSEALHFIGTVSDKKFKDIKNIDSKKINNLLHQFKGDVKESLINQVLIRSMAKAIYNNKNTGHFGLGFEDYTHFTSPIRRYADLVVHRLLKEYKVHGKPDKDRLEYLNIFTKTVSEHISATERTSMEAERASSKIAQVALVREHIGEEFYGTISGVTNFGLFVTIDEINSEGLLHIRDLKDDYYIFDEKNLKIRGKHNKKEFRFGGRIKVKIVRADLKKSLIDFEYVGKED